MTSRPRNIQSCHITWQGITAIVTLVFLVPIYPFRIRKTDRCSHPKEPAG
jgi:hypothetical protein